MHGLMREGRREPVLYSTRNIHDPKAYAGTPLALHAPHGPTSGFASSMAARWSSRCVAMARTTNQVRSRWCAWIARGCAVHSLGRAIEVKSIAQINTRGKSSVIICACTRAQALHTPLSPTRPSSGRRFSPARFIRRVGVLAPWLASRRGG